MAHETIIAPGGLRPGERFRVTAPRRVVIRALNWLGDVILALPAVRDIRNAWPEARLHVLARPSVAALYEAVPEVDGVMPASGLLEEIRILRQGFDTAILLTNSFGTALSPFLARVPERWGYATQGRGLLLTRRAPVPPSVRGRSQVHYYRAMLAAMGLPTSDGHDTSMTPPAAWIEAGRVLLGPGRVFGLAPGAAKGTAKQWPPERFALAGDRLRVELNARPVLLGAPADAEAAAAVERHLPVATNLCGRTDLRTFVGVVSCLQGLVANDSGAMHLGASLGIPTVGVFGPTNPDETHPVGVKATFVRGVAECSPCRHTTCPIDHRCLTSVSPAMVVDALLREVRS